MPKTNWCQTVEGRRDAAATNFFKIVETARVFAGIKAAELCERLKWSTQTYYRRRSSPRSLTVSEIQQLSDALNLKQFPGANEAIAQMLN